MLIIQFYFSAPLEPGPFWHYWAYHFESPKVRAELERTRIGYLAGAKVDEPNFDICYLAVAASRMQVAWRRCWQIVSALRRQLPAIINALNHEKAIAWSMKADKDPSSQKVETLKAADDLNHQAAYLVCKRIACC